MAEAPHEEQASEGAPEWMVSYADMITILMSFFVVMFSMAGTKDPKKEDPVMNSLRKQFGRYVGMTSIHTVSGLPMGKAAGHHPLPQHETHTRGLVGDNLRVSTVRVGDQPTIGGSIYFDNAKTDLSDEQKRQLDLLAKDLNGKPQKLEVRGHTVCRPQGADAKYRDNWDLAYERCHKTMEYLISVGLDPRRIRIGVSAQYEPLYTGRDPLLLERNNRVEVFMIGEFADQPRASAEETANE
jgi:chemotaxis protein MotB